MKRELLTLGMTANILVSLIAFTQPTAAVLTTVEGPDEVRQPGPVVFDVAVEIREDERVPIESFDLVIETDEGETTVPLNGGETDEDEADDDVDDEDRRIDLAIDGNVSAGENVSVTATVNGTPLANAEISVNGDVAGTTDADGTLDVTLSTAVDEVEIDVKLGELEGKWRVKFEEAEDG